MPSFTMPRFKVMLAGYGWWGQHLLPRLRDNLGFDVVAVCAPELTAPTLEGIPAFTDYDKMLRECSADAVILATPNTEHEHQVLAAAAYLAKATKNIRLGTGTVNLPNSHPAHVAGQIAMLDHMLDGRFNFGISPG